MTVHILGIEPIETRYTWQWDKLIPDMISNAGADVKVYRGNTVSASVGNSADFLAWVPTNIWKSSQLSLFASAIQAGEVKQGDTVFVTDFWNPAVLNIKYMSDLCKLNLKLVGFAHAGIYDPYDRLGQELKTTKWGKASESAIVACYDHIIFATEFHKSLFAKTHPADNAIVLPFFGNYITAQSVGQKQKQIVFCQRNTPEKQPHLFAELKSRCADLNLKWVDLSTTPLPNEEYAKVLAESKYMVSFALQETLGIGPFEALTNRCCILVPNRLSYSEMYTHEVKYNSKVDDCEILLRQLETMTQAELDAIIDKNYKKSSRFFDGTETAKFIATL